VDDRHRQHRRRHLGLHRDVVEAADLIDPRPRLPRVEDPRPAEPPVKPPEEPGAPRVEPPPGKRPPTIREPPRRKPPIRGTD
jgi:hypothetical protein